MARINIEDNLFKKAAWAELVMKTGDRSKAVGDLYWAWATAQEYWFPEKQPIPIEVWKRERLNDHIINCGFAELREDGVYMHGSESQFAWLFQRQEAGKNSAERRKEKKLKSTAVQRPLTAVERPTSSSSFSSSFSKDLELSSKKPKNDLFQKTHFDFEALYKGYPRKDGGKSKGMEICATQIKSQKDYDDLQTAIQNYTGLVAGRKTKHILLFKTFMSEWRDFIDVRVEDQNKKAAPSLRERYAPILERIEYAQRYADPSDAAQILGEELFKSLCTIEEWGMLRTRPTGTHTFILDLARALKSDFEMPPQMQLLNLAQ
jgi:hypothetical protein